MIKNFILSLSIHQYVIIISNNKLKYNGNICKAINCKIYIFKLLYFHMELVPHVVQIKRFSFAIVKPSSVLVFCLFQILCYLSLMISSMYFFVSSYDVCFIKAISELFIANDARLSAILIPFSLVCPGFLIILIVCQVRRLCLICCAFLKQYLQGWDDFGFWRLWHLLLISKLAKNCTKHHLIQASAERNLLMCGKKFTQAWEEIYESAGRNSWERRKTLMGVRKLIHASAERNSKKSGKKCMRVREEIYEKAGRMFKQTREKVIIG